MSRCDFLRVDNLGLSADALRFAAILGTVQAFAAFRTLHFCLGCWWLHVRKGLHNAHFIFAVVQ